MAFPGSSRDSPKKCKKKKYFNILELGGKKKTSQAGGLSG